MDDYDDYDEFDDDLEEDGLDDSDIEMAGSLDGEFDANVGGSLYSGFGASVNLDELTDEQRDLYEQAYYAGYDFLGDHDN